MSGLGALCSVTFKDSFALGQLGRRLRYGPQRLRALGYVALFAVALVPLGGAYITAIRWLYGALHAAGQESALLVLAVLGGQFLTFLFGFFAVVSVFYFASDLERLIPLPLRPNEVLFAKFLMLTVNQCFSALLFVLPIFVAYGIMARAPLGYWVQVVPVYLLLPVVPLALATLLAIGMMRVVNLSNKKDPLIVAGSLVLIALSIAVQVYLHKKVDPAAAMRLLAERDGLIQIMGRSFPPALWAARGLAGGFSRSGLANLGLFVAGSGIVFFAVIVLARYAFYEGAIGLSEIAARRHRLSRQDLERKLSAGQSPVRAILAREIKLMNRTPVFFLNGVLVSGLVPALLLVLTLAGGGSELTALVRASEAGQTTEVVLGIAAFGLVCGCLGGTASSAISREGRHFWISMVVPVSWRDQVAAKFLHAYLVSLLGIGAALVVAVILMHPAAQVLAGAALLAALGAVALNALALRIDLARPQLVWTDPQQAIKRNFNVVIALAVDAGVVVLCGFLARQLLRAGVRGAFVYGLLLAISVALGWGAWRELGRYADRKYPTILAP